MSALYPFNDRRPSGFNFFYHPRLLDPPSRQSSFSENKIWIPDHHHLDPGVPTVPPPSPQNQKWCKKHAKQKHEKSEHQHLNYSQHNNHVTTNGKTALKRSMSTYVPREVEHRVPDKDCHSVESFVYYQDGYDLYGDKHHDSGLDHSGNKTREIHDKRKQSGLNPKQVKCQSS